MKYKHKTPFISLHDRMKIVKAIRYVDDVVVQTDVNEFKAWERLKFNAIFHGDDWKGSALYNNMEERLKAVNVDVIFLPHTEGVLTTILTEIIRRK